MEKTNLPSDKLCFVTVAFPFTSDAEALSVKSAISAAIAELPQSKLEFRITEMKNGP